MTKVIKAIFKPVANIFRLITYKLMKYVIDDLRESPIGESNKVPIRMIPFEEDEYIRVLFLFQMASFWPGWESFYKECINDPRIIVKFTLLDEQFGDVTQMLTAKQFLDNKKIPYEVYSDRLFKTFAPHVVIMQTPYDYGHRKMHVRSNTFKMAGTRIVYIPYGIELSDTAHARDAHFCNDVVLNAWRVFTFSERMREDYRKYCSNYSAIKCEGHPKFDALYHKERIKPLSIITQKAKGRPIFVWHVHFPKITPQPDGSGVMVTPELSEYIEFAKYVVEINSVFVVLQPHPKFLDGAGHLGRDAKTIVNIIENAENGYVDWSDDYRNTMINCNYFITDRSALMVEASTAGVPILYMSNKDYYEPLTAAVRPLIDSYYQGTGFAEMKLFVEQCLNNEDPRKAEREEAFKKTIPFFDGNCGYRIKEHIVNALIVERSEKMESQLKELQLEIRDLKNEIEAINMNNRLSK